MTDTYIRLNIRCLCSECGKEVIVAQNYGTFVMLEPCQTCLERVRGRPMTELVTLITERVNEIREEDRKEGGK